MKLDGFIKTTKQAYPRAIVLIQVGSFYHAYGKDSYILSYLFGYQVKELEGSICTCGMPVASINKVLKQLEDNEVSYVTMVKSQNYDISAEMNYKQDNKYEEIYDKAHKYVNKKRRITAISNYLLENVETPGIIKKIQDVENILYGEEDEE